MKKLSIITFFTLLVTFASYGQGAYFGLKAGATLMNIKGADAGASDAKLGGMFSLSLNSVLGDYVWLKHDFMGSMKGAKYDVAGTTYKNTMVYLEAYPLSIAFHYEGAQLFVGPQIGVLLSSYTIDGDGNDVTPADPLDGMNLFEAGLVAGIEYEFEFGLNLGVRFTKGFTSLIEPITGAPRVEAYNQGFMFTTGYTFGRN